MSSGTPPPSDLGAEETVLSELLSRPEEVFDRIASIIQPNYFYSAANQHIAQMVWDLQESGKKVDITAIATELHNRNLIAAVGGTAYLLTLLNTVPAVSHVEQHAATVRDKWRLRQAIALFQYKATEALGGNLELAEQQWLEQAESQLAQIVHDLRNESVVTLHEILEGVLHDLQGGPRDEDRVRTGFIELDRMVGGLYDGDLVLLAGRPGTGKSTLLQNIVLNMAHENECGAAVFSPEMTGDQVAMRMLCSDTGLDFMKYRARSFGNADWPLLTEGCARLGKKPIWIDDSSTITVLEMRAKVRQVARSITQGTSPIKAKRLGLVAVDYLQLVKGVREKGGSREQEVASISRDLKALAKDLKVPVLALSSMNRAVEQRGKEKKPEMSDLRESGSLESDADAVWLMHRPDYYDAANRPGECDVIVGKQRLGPTGTVTLQFTKSKSKFNNYMHGGADPDIGSDGWYQDR